MSTYKFKIIQLKRQKPEPYPQRKRAVTEQTFNNG